MHTRFSSLYKRKMPSQHRHRHAHTPTNFSLSRTKKISQQTHGHKDTDTHTSRVAPKPICRRAAPPPCSGGGTGRGWPSSPTGLRNSLDNDSLNTDWPNESPNTICPPVFSMHTFLLSQQHKTPNEKNAHVAMVVLVAILLSSAISSDFCPPDFFSFRFFLLVVFCSRFFFFFAIFIFQEERFPRTPDRM